MHPAEPDASSLTLPTASLARRLGAVLYDSLLLAALLMLVSFVYLPLVGRMLPPGINRPLYQLLLLAVSYAYFAGFWVRGGQTLGLRTWKLRLVGRDGGPVTWTRATWRFLAALFSWLCLGLGFLWVLVDPEKLAWHDRLSNTRLVRLPDTPR
ncbi:MAG: RDD family protein [Gammaproteobacteria bacterium]|nr:MAG: RDD family protein [Gammaproteobacteria bacterium]